MLRIGFIISVCCFLAGVSSGKQINTAQVSGVWTKANSPYYIMNDIEVPDNSVLVIEPGVHLIFKGHYKLQVNGALVAKGNATDSIYFLPADTVSGWRGVQIDNSNLGANGAMNDNDSSLFAYCVFQWARNIGDNYYRGSAFYLREFSKVYIANSLFSNNYSMVSTPSDGSGKGAGLFLRDTRGIVDNCSFFNNHVVDDGGALYANNAGTISNCVFKYNSAYEDGGAIAVFYGAKFEACLIDSNNALTEEGGGIHAENGVEIIGCTITNNGAGNSGSGGGIYMLKTGKVSNCIIENNYCGKLGGGIYATEEGTITYSIINSNSANEGGGVIFDASASSTAVKLIAGCRIQNNSANVGGGIKTVGTQVVNCIISNNKAKVLAGGFRGEKSTLVNCTIVNNEGPGAGGISSKGTNEVYNTVVWNNAEPQVSEDFSGLVVKYCAVDGMIDKSKFIHSVDLYNRSPNFKLPVSFRGTAGSQNQLSEIRSASWQPDQYSLLINAGDNSLYNSQYDRYDIDSNARVQKNTIDIGVYESVFTGVSVNSIQTSDMELSIQHDVEHKQIVPQGKFSSGTLKIVVVTGTAVSEHKVHPGEVLSLDSYPPGLLIVLLEAKGQIISRRIIQQ